MSESRPAGGVAPSVAVVIPALNEAGNIGAVVADTLLQPVDLVVVADNGSTDDTADVALAAGASVVREPRRGYGAACAAGSAVALDAGADVVVYLDGDGSSPPSELGHLVAPIVDGSADLVLGSRVLGRTDPGSMAPHQRLGNRFAAAVSRRVLGVTVTDLGPFRAIRADVLRELDMTEMTFGWPSEMTAKCAVTGRRVVEVPATWRARRTGRSKVSGTVKGSVLAGYFILWVTVREAARARRRSTR